MHAIKDKDKSILKTPHLEGAPPLQQAQAYL